MNISIEEIKNALSLTKLHVPGEIFLFESKEIELTYKEALDLPSQCTVTPFVFASNNSLFGGIVTNFVLEGTEKSEDPFIVENSSVGAVDEMKTSSGFVHAKLFNPLKDSQRAIEALPCNSGDCFIFEL